MGEVRWSKKAVSQLQRNVTYIVEEQSVVYAELVLARILNAVDLLKENPRMGTIESFLAYRRKEYRFLVIWSYKIVYKVQLSGDVLIVRVFHTSQNPSKILR